MEKIRILTDTGADFPKPYPDNLTVLSLTIRFGDEEYRDGIDIDHATFFQKLAQSRELPKTSLIPPSEFAAAFEAAAQAGETVIALVLSSKLSGTCQSAMLAAQDMPNVFVVDTLNATLGQQILVRHALNLADAGLSAREIVARLEQDKTRIRLLGVPDTLEYLQKGGRISKTVAFVGGALSIKPILALREGVVEMIGKVRGAKNVDAFLLQEIDKYPIDTAMPLCVGYTGLSDDALRRFLASTDRFAPDVPVTSVGATIGTHVGPNAIVAAYFELL